jgi:hypothetical protein
MSSRGLVSLCCCQPYQETCFCLLMRQQKTKREFRLEITIIRCYYDHFCLEKAASTCFLISTHILHIQSYKVSKMNYICLTVWEKGPHWDFGRADVVLKIPWLQYINIIVILHFNFYILCFVEICGTFHSWAPKHNGCKFC